MHLLFFKKSPFSEIKLFQINSGRTVEGTLFPTPKEIKSSIFNFGKSTKRKRRMKVSCRNIEVWQRFYSYRTLLDNINYLWYRRLRWIEFVKRGGQRVITFISYQVLIFNVIVSFLWYI